MAQMKLQGLPSMPPTAIRLVALVAGALVFSTSGAFAEDAIPSGQGAEPPPVEPCASFGAGYTTIPGTRTCIKIGGYARVDIGGGDIVRGGKRAED